MLTDLLDSCATASPARNRFHYLAEDGSIQRLSNAELQQRARAVANALLDQGEPGQRVLLAYSPGLDFITGFFGCLYAGMPAVVFTRMHESCPPPSTTKHQLFEDPRSL